MIIIMTEVIIQTSVRVPAPAENDEEVRPPVPGTSRRLCGKSIKSSSAPRHLRHGLLPVEGGRRQEVPTGWEERRRQGLRV